MTINVGGTDYPAIDNGDGTWTAEVPGSALAANTSVTATAVFTDSAGNPSTPVTDTRPYTVDTGIPRRPNPHTRKRHRHPGDGITSDGTVDVSGLEPSATWEYSTNGGTTWTPGTGTSFELTLGTYDADDVQVRQTDLRRQHQRRRPARPCNHRHHRPLYRRCLGDHFAHRRRRRSQRRRRPHSTCPSQ